MIEQPKEERQVVGLDPPFVHGQDESPLRRFEQPVRIRDPFRNALERNQPTDIVMSDQLREILGTQMGIDGHLSRSAGAAA